ncbi:hypothetical protein SAMN05443633_105223 [Chryseobacterium arachidis]|uniref:Uncharacterized protein n=1 Tax=Chryseobacterium arachidis TaxID=1416778 RepID=A0A1M5DAI4_9FLAO|nr:hypothetical protein SAMN05443633_105223 [Chryseobacterium arachidis]
MLFCWKKIIIDERSEGSILKLDFVAILSI